ncbi:MAG: hypothetical protein IJ574_00185 [Bacilli bacterium]|nr:hypothetical protein [Bacilli bacterium]
MKKKSLVLAAAICTIAFPTISKADECFYTNTNNVCFSEEQYDFVTNMYYEGYQDIMNQADIDFFDDSVFDSRVEKETYYEYLDGTMGTTHSTANKKVEISKATGGNTYLTTVATWFNSPSTRSYDVIGAYLSGPTLVNTGSAYATATGGTNNGTGTQIQTHGFGTSVKLPSGSSVRVVQTFSVSGSGTVYASYQHATSSISLANSKKYNIAYSGYGHVFSFYGAASGVYDGMGGVDIAV